MRRHNEYDFDGEPYVFIERHESAGIGPFLLGLALGAGAALLFAPRSGADTRARIKTRARDASDAARAKVDDLTSTLTDRVNEARDAVSDRIDTVRTNMRRRRDEIHDAFEVGRSAAQQARVDLEERIAERKRTEYAEPRTERGVNRAADGFAYDTSTDDLDDEE